MKRFAYLEQDHHDERNGPRPIALTCLTSTAMLLLFRVEPKNHLLNVAFSAMFDLDPKAGWKGLIRLRSLPFSFFLPASTSFNSKQHAR